MSDVDADGKARAAFARDVAAGLGASPKRLPCRWFYDEEGSRLFEEICRQPEYYIPAAEREILQGRADEMLALAPPGATLYEFGSGSAEKTRLLLEAALRRDGSARYVPIDVSRSALELSAAALGADYPGLAIDPVAGEYARGIERLEADRRRGAKLVLWLGSNVGNLGRAEAARFLASVRAPLRRADRLLVGIDLRKDRAVLERAYDDAAGVTARFNLNLLARINRELGGRFDVGAFAHRAAYDEEAGRIQMFLVSRRAQRVRVEGLGLEVPFDAGETIHTEDSWKYSPEEIDLLARAARLVIERRWLDPASRFCEVLLAPAP